MALKKGTDLHSPKVENADSVHSESDEPSKKRLSSCGLATPTGLTAVCPGKVPTLKLGGDKTG